MELENLLQLSYFEKVQMIEANKLNDNIMRELAMQDRDLMPVIASNENISYDTAQDIFVTQCYKSLLSLNANKNRENILTSEQIEDLDSFAQNKSFKQHYTCTTCDQREQIDCLVGKANKTYQILIITKTSIINIFFT